MLLHVDKLREGEGEESYKVVEAAGIEVQVTDQRADIGGVGRRA